MLADANQSATPSICPKSVQVDIRVNIADTVGIYWEVPMFSLRFKETSIRQWAARNDGDLSIMQQIGEDVQKRGHIRKSEFLELCAKKSPRTRSRCASNSEDFIREVSKLSLATSHEQLRIEVLTLLKGVSWPTASFLLHFCSKSPYPILDFRALWSLRTEQPTAYDFPFWFEYTKFCRELSERNQVSMRVLDSALWQYSKEKQK